MSLVKVDLLPDDMSSDEFPNDLQGKPEKAEEIEEKRIQYISRLKIMVRVLDIKPAQLKWAISETEIDDKTSWEAISNFFDGLLELLSSKLPMFSVPGGERVPSSYKNPHEDIVMAFGESNYEELLSWIEKGVRSERQPALH